MASLNVVALLVLVYAIAGTTGQGLGLAKASTVGASSTLSQLQQLYSGSQAWKRAYKQSPKSACSKGGRGSLCAAASTDDASMYAQLMLATSPQAYSSTNSGSAVQLVAPPQDQQQCLTCAAFAVAAAAETAMASVLQVDVRECSIGVQALYFCPPGRPTRSCSAGWNLPDALEQLQQRGQSLPTTTCLPYTPDFRRQLTASQLCTGSCSTPNQHASKGQFSSIQITNFWEAQQHIRQYGAVVSRFDVLSDFKAFFAEKRNAKAVYRPSANARFEFGHAIALVGYNNEQRYWLAKNSYGSSWADGGMFKVAYGACSVLTPDTGEAYGIIWTPINAADAHKLQLQRGPTPNCYWYKARPGDSISKVAWLAGIPLDKFMLDNAATVKDLDAPLNGTQLLLCKPQQAHPATADPQLESLLKIRAAIDTTGVLQEWSSAAGASGGYCKWRGVRCLPGTTDVADINIWSGPGVQGLQGTLPPAAAFSGLPNMTVLNIGQQPGIRGTMPAGWSRLTQLVDVRLTSSSLTGSIPASWGSLAKLRILNLTTNSLSGKIPDSIKGMVSLQLLILNENKLTGSIPAAISSLTGLNGLGLGNNRLTGPLPDALKALTSLDSLYLDRNALTGSLPAWLGSFAYLRELNLEGNKFTGSIPAALGGLRRLKALGLGANKFSGTLPDALKALSGLEQLSMYGNALVGPVPASWSGMTSLRNVWVMNNPGLEGCLPGSWWRQLAVEAEWDVRAYVESGTKLKGFC